MKIATKVKNLRPMVVPTSTNDELWQDIDNALAELDFIKGIESDCHGGKIFEVENNFLDIILKAQKKILNKY